MNDNQDKGKKSTKKVSQTSRKKLTKVNSKDIETIGLNMRYCLKSKGISIE